MKKQGLRLGLAGAASLIVMATSAFGYDYRASYVNVVSSAGNGCLREVTARWTDGGRSILLTLDNMAVLAGAGADLADSLAACEIKLDVGLPNGVKYTVKSFETLAHLNIERGGSASLQVRYGFPGTRQGLASLSFQGGPERDSLLKRDFSYLNQYFSSCYSHRPVTVDVRLASKTNFEQSAIADAELLTRGHTIKLPLNIVECE